jgi:hypothetical protein
MAAGTLIVLAVLPGRRGFASKSAEPGAGAAASEAAALHEDRRHPGGVTAALEVV